MNYIEGTRQINSVTLEKEYLNYKILTNYDVTE